MLDAGAGHFIVKLMALDQNIASQAAGPQESEQLAWVRQLYRELLAVPDDAALLLTLAAVVANRLDGEPVWLMLVGAPGCGKTETLMTLGRVEGVHITSKLTEAGMLSGTPARERAKGARGGLLRQLV